MISKDLLLITGYKKISIINENLYDLVRIIDVSCSNSIYAACFQDKDIIYTADDKKSIIKQKIENDNLKMIYKIENARNGIIYTLSKLENGLILSGGTDEVVKIW